MVYDQKIIVYRFGGLLAQDEKVHLWSSNTPKHVEMTILQVSTYYGP